MKKISLHLIILMVALATTLSAIAQAPSLINYQAVARNAAGAALASQTVAVQLTVLNGSATGTVVYVERHTVVTNAFGLFAVSIGGGTAITGTFAGINWATGTKFLKTELDPAGGTAFVNISTTQLMSVPYALYAASGGTGDNWGTQGVVTDTTLNGQGTNASPLRIAKHGATTGQYLRWSGTTWMPATNINYWAKSGVTTYLNSSGNVGIGTTNAGAKLQVKGHTIIDSSLVVDYAGSDTGSLASGLTFGTFSGEGIASNRGSAGSQPNVNGLDLYTNFAKRMTITNGGAVGVGTSSPNHRLEVAGDGSFWGNLIVDGSNTNGGTVTPGINFGNAGEGISSNRTGGTNQFGIDFYTQSSIKMSLTNAGYLGIGTANPGANLHIIHSYGFSNHGIILEDNFASTSWNIYTSTGGDLWFNSQGAQKGVFNYTSGVYTSVSDIQFKKDIETMSSVLNKVMQLKPSLYHFKEQNADGRKFIGMIAQEIQPLFPELVFENKGKNDGAKDFLTVDYSSLSVIAIKAIQEQQKEIEDLKVLVAALQAEIAAGKK